MLLAAGATFGLATLHTSFGFAFVANVSSLFKQRSRVVTAVFTTKPR